MALGEDNFRAWLYFNHLCSRKGSNPEINLVIVIRTQRASVQMGLKTCYINSYICRKFRYHCPHVFTGRASSEATEPQVCLWIYRTFRVCLYQQPSGKIALCLTKPGSAKDFEVRWIGARVLTLPISNWVILDEVLQLLSFNFFIFQMEMVRPDSPGFVWIRWETIWEGTSHTPEY